MYYRAFFGTITMLGLAALIGMFAVLSSPISPPSPAYAQETSNSPPVFTEENPANRSVAENTQAGQNIDGPITAADEDDARLTYWLGGDDATSFDIVATSGQLRTKAALDFESTKKSYTVTVLVSDFKNASDDADTKTDDTITVTISVTNVDEAGDGNPVVASTPGGYSADRHPDRPGRHPWRAHRRHLEMGVFLRAGTAVGPSSARLRQPPIPRAPVTWENTCGPQRPTVTA